MDGSFKKKQIEKIRMDKTLHFDGFFMITDRNIGFNFILVNDIYTLNLIEDNS